MAPKVADISPRGKLRLIREIDIFHPWQSLDEIRYCRRCGQTFSGHEIKVITAEDGRSRRLECPTEGCPSVPIEWILVEGLEKQLAINPRLHVTLSRGCHPARHPQYRPGLFGFLRVPLIF